MSADNIIYVKKEAEDRWLVWEDRLSNFDPVPPSDVEVYQTREGALDFAEDESDDHFVEYGVAVYNRVGKSIREQDEDLNESDSEN